jgi:hypothetical protein
LVKGLIEQEIVADTDVTVPIELKSSFTTEKVKLKEIELQQQKLDFDRRKLEMEIEMKTIEMAHELKIKELELQVASASTSGSRQRSCFDVSKHVRLVPPFDEKDVDKYFHHFEKVAYSLDWPSEVWTLLLQSVLRGRAQEIYSSLSITQSADYKTVKEAILKAYELVPEAYRQKFRSLRKTEGVTYVEFARLKEDTYNKWCISVNVDNYGGLRELMLVEEFKRCLPSEVKTFMDERKVTSLHDAAVLADDYSLTHKQVFATRKSGHSGSQGQGSAWKNTGSGTPKMTTSEGAGTSTSSTGGSSSPTNSGKVKFSCFYCKKEGHKMADCRVLQRKGSKNPGSNALVVSCSEVQNSCEVKRPPQEVDDRIVMKPHFDVESHYLPFVSTGSVSIPGTNRCVPVVILRDTGASQSLILEAGLGLNENTHTGRNILIQGVECGDYIPVPLHSVHLNSDLFTGLAEVGVRPTLPVKGVTFILGNDIAGGRVSAKPIVVSKPICSDTSDSLRDEFPEVFKSCVVTRAKAKLVQSRREPVIPLDDCNVSLDKLFEPEQQTGESHAEAGRDDSDCLLVDAEDVSGSVGAERVSVKGDSTEYMFSHEELVKGQESDPGLCKLAEQIVSNTDHVTEQVCLYIDNGVLMRRWRPPDASVDEEWKVRHQIVVPTKCRSEVLKLAHGSPMGSHLGVRKTYYRILQYFFWPGLRQDVVKHCRECHSCQVVGKPNQGIPVYPLQPIPSVGEAFGKMPLPKTSNGMQYLLTIMCGTTRFPEAIPLRNITARSVIKALIRFFSWVGLPKYALQSDNGSNFIAKVFEQVMDQLGIKHVKSSPYHPESQGVLERFHSTLKNLLAVYCHENEKSWDEGVPLVLFAVRESVQESLGFSPFQLVFGHEVRGPLKLLHEKWLCDDAVEGSSKVNLLDYVTNFRYRLSQAVELATSHLESAQSKMKSLYDRKAKERSFAIGDQVLVMLPS